MTFVRNRSAYVFVAILAIETATLGFLVVSRPSTQVHAAKRPAVLEDATSQPIPQPNATPVLVELFTSEGCSSCPPADALLARLLLQQPVANANVIVLEEHVDYWESLGWHDRFSSHQFTERQTGYAQRFRLDDNATPQMVFDGVDQFAGNDPARALRIIAQVARTPKLPLTLSALTLVGNHITATLSTSAPNLPKASLYAALVEPTASTQVRSGENGGHTLRHVSVVRELVRIGSLDALKGKSLPLTLALPQTPAAARLSVVVFAQREGQNAILAAASSSPIDSQIAVKPLVSQNIR